MKDVLGHGRDKLDDLNLHPIQGLEVPNNLEIAVATVESTTVSARYPQPLHRQLKAHRHVATDHQPSHGALNTAVVAGDAGCPLAIRNVLMSPTTTSP